MSQNDFSSVFQTLKTILEPYADFMRVVNTPELYSLDSTKLGKNKKPIFFGSTKIGNSYVSYYLMPVYIFPDLLEQISPELKRHMQGKSCFNFKKPEPALFLELEALTRKGFERYQQEGLVDAAPKP